MKVGFTGTQKGMTRKQLGFVAAWLAVHEVSLFIHGDCIGADAEAHAIAFRQKIPIVLRPCTIKAKRAFCEGATIVHKPEAPLVRNRKIVTDCDMLLAAPATAEEVMRSGTWATLRHAWRVQASSTIVFPDGTSEPRTGRTDRGKVGGPD